MKKAFLSILISWVPIAFLICSISLVIYVTIQQDIRIGANDPQIQIAEDLALSLNNNEKISITNKIDIDKGLAPFTIIYDKEGTVKETNAVLNDKTPEIPFSVLKNTDKIGLEKNQDKENRITWQPQENVRIATVVVAYDKGYVLVGRNMREIEIRERNQFNNILLFTITTLSISLIYVISKKLIKKSL